MRRHPDLLDHITPTQFMAAQYVPEDVRDFLLKHIASVAQIEALLLIWSGPEEALGAASDRGPHLCQRHGNGEGARRTLRRRVAALRGRRISD